MPRRSNPNPPPCSFAGCSEPSKIRGVCRRHYYVLYSRRDMSTLTPANLPMSIPDRILNFTVRDEATGCLLWTGALTAEGYGTYGPDRAHRFSYEHHKGPIPDGMNVCHRCDRPGCIEPEHLFLGSHGDNVADKCAKGRHPVGQDAPGAKLVTAQVVAIRSDPRTPTEIANDNHVSPATVRDIKSRRTWRHIL